MRGGGGGGGIREQESKGVTASFIMRVINRDQRPNEAMYFKSNVKCQISQSL